MVDDLVWNGLEVNMVDWSGKHGAMTHPQRNYDAHTSEHT